MQIKKCDVCGKTIKGEYVNLGYVNEGSRGGYLSTRHEVCAACAKTVIVFMEKNGLIKDTK